MWFNMSLPADHAESGRGSFGHSEVCAASPGGHIAVAGTGPMGKSRTLRTGEAKSNLQHYNHKADHEPSCS